MRFFFNVLGIVFSEVSLILGMFFCTLFSHVNIPSERYSWMLSIFCLTVVGTCIDLLYRIYHDDDGDPLWLRLVSPASGGNLMFVPVWLIGPIVLIWSLFPES